MYAVDFVVALANDLKNLSCDVALQTPNRLHFRMSFVQALSDVLFGTRVSANSSDGNYVQSTVFRIAFAIAVLGRWRRGDQGGVNDGALAHRQAFAGQMAVDFAEDALGQFMLLKQPPELQQRRRVGRRFMGQIEIASQTARLQARRASSSASKTVAPRDAGPPFSES